MLREGRRLFGTDGIRGVANTELTPDFVMELGRAAGESLSHGPVLVGRDTRRSGEMLSAALQSGFHSVGVDTVDVGVLPSGGVSHLTGSSGAVMGAIISASHNPASDNGVKLLAASGAKLTDAEEDGVEARLRSGRPYKKAVGEGVGTRFPNSAAGDQYVDFLAGLSEYTFRGMEIVLDCANGAAYQMAPRLFNRLKADVTVMAADPDGTNINDGVGATSPAFLAGAAEGRLGLAFDGDADRLIAIDENGVPANGDVIMAVIARHLHERGRLKNNTVVSTVMSNLGFRKAIETMGLVLVQTKVGDRYVLEGLREHGATFGGEQSGHVIFLKDLVTGDGLLTALHLVEVLAASGRTLADLRQEIITEYPQILRNVRVTDS
ncbi:MAG: phosphoglucosamine mutase, partial [Acidimicrobiia bacterium]|nr:phosphoglucosamine mutase [Acidimicrobiia bacterium]